MDDEALKKRWSKTAPGFTYDALNSLCARIGCTWEMGDPGQIVIKGIVRPEDAVELRQCIPMSFAFTFTPDWSNVKVMMFSRDATCATLDNKKSQARRVLSQIDQEALTFLSGEEGGVPDITYGKTGHSGAGWYASSKDYPDEGSHFLSSATTVAGDLLWIREADESGYDGEGRILWIEVTAARIERLQSITEEDAYAEGCTDRVLVGEAREGCAVADFRQLWDAREGRKTWDTWESNPWVQVLEFKVLRRAETEK